MTTEPKKRAKIVEGKTHKQITGCGNLYVTINHDEEGLVEIFAHLGKTGQCGAAQNESLCRAISIGLRSGVDPNVFIKQLSGIRCESPIWDDGIQILSCADAISIALKEEIDNMREHNETNKVTSDTIKKS